jgi:molybdenum cofactor cytidylyltransferase
MKFGPLAAGEAAGAILAHAVSVDGRILRKGHVIGAADVEAFRVAGIGSVVAAVLEPDDLGEDEAASRIAVALAGDHVTVETAATGRCNLFADAAGLLEVDRAGIDALNALDPGITFATLDAHSETVPGRMVATVKIIPFALPRALVDCAVASIRAGRPLVRVAPFVPKTVAVVSTLLPSLKPSVIDKTLRVMAQRLAPAGARIVSDRRVAHAEAPLAAAIRAGVEEDHADLVVVFGASAVVDRHDVIPAAIEIAGGTVEHFGMPVDPGNLLLVGRLDGHPVIGAPGCARSPRENGFDWILARHLADLPVTPREIVGLGVGGLLMDIVTRPAPREAPREADAPARRRIAAVLLAAGRSTRMGGPNKLLAVLDGKPLVRHAAEAALGSRASSVVVVTGHMAEAIEAALAGLDVTILHNPDYRDGLSTSLKAGIAAVPADAEAAVIMLGDMPRVTAATVDRLIEAYDPGSGALVVVPTAEGRRGNPTLISRRFFPDLMAVTGDIGARQVLQGYPEAVVEVEMGIDVGLDLDTPEALEQAGGRPA